MMRLPICAVTCVAVFFLYGPSAAVAQTPDASSQDTLHRMQDLTKKTQADTIARSPTQTPVALSTRQTRESEELANSLLRAAQLNQALIVPGDGEKPIYGPADHRMNYDDTNVTDAQRRAADATAILVKAIYVTAAPDGKTVNLPGGNVLDRSTGTGLCTNPQADMLHRPHESFCDEPNPGFCSAFRISRNRVVTAGHCIRTPMDCQETRIIFGFYHSPVKLHPERAVPVANVFSCKKIISGIEDDNGPDWRVIEVDRDISIGSNVELRTSNTQPDLKVGDELTVIGYPLGLPVKIAGNAKVRAFGHGFLIANLDTYEGNSGSAVFNSARLADNQLLVEGILVRGENDFAVTNPCFLSKRCPVDGCRGEDVTLATQVSAGLLK